MRLGEAVPYTSDMGFVAQLVEHLVVIRVVMGSSPILPPGGGLYHLPFGRQNSTINGTVLT